MASSSMKDARIPAARCFYRAAAELIQMKLKANASPNGEAERGSQQHKQLIRAVTSFIRVMSSWAQMEFDLRSFVKPMSLRSHFIRFVFMFDWSIPNRFIFMNLVFFFCLLLRMRDLLLLSWQS